MNSQLGASTEAEAQQTEQRATSTINSNDALTMIDHGSELNIEIVTPVGTTYRGKSLFIGTHSNRMILLELPKVSDDQLEYFFQEGFWATIHAISPRGEGAILQYRSQILHIVKAPVAMMLMSIPQTMQVTPLRNEPRYEVALEAKAHTMNHRIDCEIRDLSKSGCMYITPSLSRPFKVGELIELHLITNKEHKSFEPLFGIVCNARQSGHKRQYGVKFDQRGKANAKALLANLKYDGSRLSLR
ncbi:flagellar brake protein [Vibrio sp. LaRot3]|uniref:flagellar brake protein n=1 Tax=Vibrio sp. LaRot3 TaxID=2998829 RepID=UPI0022CDC258|nr:flagellar brake protein [Vibrio sp. LaRot3]MDA0148965.1 flagellar brake protein [Vibrio sp. LaRot3]